MSSRWQVAGAAVLSAALCGVWWVVVAGPGSSGTSVTAPLESAAWTTAAAEDRKPGAAPQPVLPPTPSLHEPQAQVAAANPAPSPAPSPVVLEAFPYRYAGSTGAGADSEVVLFGRGRTVTLRGPGPVDDEYVVEHFFEQGLQWRHLPSGRSQVLLFGQRQAAAAPTTRPEDFPAD